MAQTKEQEKHRIQIVEAWESLGLSKEEASIAADVEAKYVNEADISLADWANLNIGGSR